MTRFKAALGSLALGVCLSPAASAQVTDTKKAEALFDEALTAVQKGDDATACPKFEESRKLAPGLGVTLYLADCMAKTGHTARALELFHEGAELAAARKDQRQKVALGRAAELEATVPKLTITVSALAPDQVVRLDGEFVSEAQWTALRADPGAHVVTSEAGGRTPFRQEFTLAAGEQRTLAIPELAATPVVAAAPVATDSAPKPSGFHWTTRREIGVAVAGAGVVGLVVSGVFILNARSSYNQSSNYCDPNNFCLQKGVSLRDDASSDATVSTVAFLLGAAAMGGGAYLFFTTPHGDKVAIVPVATPQVAGVTAIGRF